MKEACIVELRVWKDGDNNETHIALRRPVLALFTHYISQLMQVLIANAVDVVHIFQDSIIVECSYFYQLQDVLCKQYEVDCTIPHSVIDFIHRFHCTTPSLAEIETKIGKRMFQAMRVYQQEALQLSLSMERFFNASDMGLGKTFMFLASAVFRRAHWPILCFTPKAVRHTLLTEIHHWISPDVRVNIIRTGDQVRSLQDRSSFDFLIMTYNMLPQDGVLDALIALQFDMVLLDESHYVKSQRSKRSIDMRKLLQRIRFKTLMSGTPGSSPENLYHQIQLLYEDVYPLFFHPRDEDSFQYARRYCNPKQVRIGSTCQWEFRGCENQQELAAVLSLFMLRIRKDEVLKSLPPKIRKCVMLEELTPDEYRLLQMENAKKLDKNGIEQKDFTFMDNYRLTSTLKTPSVLKCLDDILIQDLLENDPELRCLIFIHHEAIREAIVDLLKRKHISHITIHGKTPDKKRTAMQQEFQNKQHRCAVLSISACGTGLTLTAASLVIFPEVYLDANTHFQAEDRAARLGQLHTVNVWYLLTPKTTDEITWRMICRKQERMSEMIEGEKRTLRSGRCSVQSLETNSDLPFREVASSHFTSSHVAINFDSLNETPSSSQTKIHDFFTQMDDDVSSCTTIDYSSWLNKNFSL